MKMQLVVVMVVLVIGAVLVGTAAACIPIGDQTDPNPTNQPQKSTLIVAQVQNLAQIGSNSVEIGSGTATTICVKSCHGEVIDDKDEIRRIHFAKQEMDGTFTMGSQVGLGVVAQVQNLAQVGSNSVKIGVGGTSTIGNTVADNTVAKGNDNKICVKGGEVIDDKDEIYKIFFAEQIMKGTYNLGSP